MEKCVLSIGNILNAGHLSSLQKQHQMNLRECFRLAIKLTNSSKLTIFLDSICITLFLDNRLLK